MLKLLIVVVVSGGLTILSKPGGGLAKATAFISILVWITQKYNLKKCMQKMQLHQLKLLW